MNPYRSLAAICLGLAAVACAGPASAQVDALPWVSAIVHEPATPCPDSSYQLVVRGTFPTPCGRVLAARVLSPTAVELRVQTPYPATAFCLPDSVAWEHRFPMPGLAGGQTHLVTVIMVVVDETNPGAPPVVHSAEHPVTVGTQCDSLPRPDPMSFVSRLFINAPGPGGIPKPVICPLDSVLVQARGWLPNDCYVLRRIELVPSPVMSPLPVPPIVRFVFDDRACLDRACREIAESWAGRTLLPPLPAGNYQLVVQAAIVTCRDSVLPGDPLSTALFPFHVASLDSCDGGTSACLWPSWDHSVNVSGCDTSLDGEGRATVTMKVASNTALAGLQGVVRAWPSQLGLRVRALEPVGPAAGMRIQTTSELDGMRFVMFALDGAPIPPTDLLSGVPVLRVHLESYPVVPAVVLPERWTISVDEVLGADAQAGPVPVCPIRTLDGASLVAEVATVCRRRSCDFNHDGREDVRDLVGLVRCLNGLAPCDSGATGGVDCQRDGDFDLDDVVCCAISMLSRGACVNCFGDSARPAPAVALRFGEPQATETGLRVPLRLSGAGEVGGARFALRYPREGWRVAALETDRLPSSWLGLHTQTPDAIGVALLRLGPETTLSLDDTIELGLLLEPIEGADGAGEVRVADAEFSGTDGVRLEVNGVEPVMPIGNPSALALSAASPNPFDASTSFQLTLGARTAVAVAVYDLAGRRVATLHDGVLAAGVHPFTWGGRRDDGSRASGGVYFYRAESGGRVTSRKMVLLGAR